MWIGELFLLVSNHGQDTTALSDGDEGFHHRLLTAPALCLIFARVQDDGGKRFTETVLQPVHGHHERALHGTATVIFRPAHHAATFTLYPPDSVLRCDREFAGGVLVWMGVDQGGGADSETAYNISEIPWIDGHRSHNCCRCPGHFAASDSVKMAGVVS